MLRTANKPISVPSGISVDINTKSRVMTFKKDNHTLTRKIHMDVDVNFDAGQNAITVSQSDVANEKTVKAQLGTCCAHVKNILKGLSEGFKSELIISGTGYKGKLQGKDKLILSLGFSHDVEFDIPAGITAEMPSQTELNLSSYCIETLGNFSDRILRRRKLCRYKGKGVRLKNKPFVAKVVRKS